MSRTALRPWRPRAGEWDVAAAAHLLRRAGFGPAPGEAEELAAGTVEDAIGAVLARDAHDERLFRGVQALLGQESIERIADWWMSLILAGGAPLRERVTLMWHDHFATSDAKVGDARMMYTQNQLLREHGLGDFRVLLHRVARDPAMLVWLDGNSNKAGQPNENFAREVMELFALGIGNYAERDIKEAARALTGWGTQGRAFRLREADHDDGEKVLFGERGRFRGEDALDRILAHPACARHVARRLLVEFVAPSPETAWIDEAARTLVAHDWSIAATIEAILRSELFFSPAARRTRIASPVELVAQALRRLGARLPAQRAAEAVGRMGQSLFRPPSVKGWDGMRAWINAGTWVARHNLLVRLAQAHRGDVDGVRVDLARAFSSAREVVAGLVPDLAGSELARRVESAVADLEDEDERLATATALVLTAPEYHLV